MLGSADRVLKVDCIEPATNPDVMPNIQVFEQIAVLV
jgi:hypothetical protein